MLDYIIKIYSSTYNWGYFLNKTKIASIIRKLMVWSVGLLDSVLLKPKKRLLEENRDPKIIVSLTSFPGRINIVWKTIITLINQSYSPDKIILWLSMDQFTDDKDLPYKLKALKAYGLEIRFVPGDIRSHKKYAYAFREFPNDYVLLVDDDILYPSDMIETLMKGMSPDKVHCSYGSIVQYDIDGRPLKYEEWQPVIDKYYGEDFFFGSGGGTLLMPSALNQGVLDIDEAIKLCPTADDIWLNTMCRLSGLKIEKVRSGLIFPSRLIEKQTLHSKNVGLSQNDVQITNIIKAFPSVFIPFNKYRDSGKNN